MQTFINTWSKTLTGKYENYKVESKPIYQNGDYAIYKLHKDSHLYTYKNVAVSNLVGVNTPLVDSLVKGERPADGNKFLYDRVVELMGRCNAEGLIN